MKKGIFLSLAVFFFSLHVFAQTDQINWLSMNEAMAAQAKTPKKIMMDAYTNWCGPCKLLDKNTFQNSDVVDYVNKNYYAVKFNAEGEENIEYKGQTFTNPNFDASRTGRNSQHQLAGALNITAYPTIVFFDEKGNTLIPLPGYKTPKQLELFLKLFLNNGHENITTQDEWNAYQKKFKSEFKG